MHVSRKELDKYQKVKVYMDESKMDILYDGKPYNVDAFMDEDGNIGFIHDGKEILSYWVK